MKKLFLVLGALLQTICSIGQENITAQYLQNPSFELDVPKSTDAVNNTADGLRGYTLAIPSGWSVVGTNVTNDKNDKIDVYAIPSLPVWYVWKCICDKVGVLVAPL